MDDTGTLTHKKFSEKRCWSQHTRAFSIPKKPKSNMQRTRCFVFWRIDADEIEQNYQITSLETDCRIASFELFFRLNFATPMQTWNKIWYLSTHYPFARKFSKSWYSCSLYLTYFCFPRADVPSKTNQPNGFIATILNQWVWLLPVCDIYKRFNVIELTSWKLFHFLKWILSVVKRYFWLKCFGEALIFEQFVCCVLNDQVALHKANHSHFNKCERGYFLGRSRPKKQGPRGVGMEQVNMTRQQDCHWITWLLHLPTQLCRSSFSSTQFCLPVASCLSFITSSLPRCRLYLQLPRLVLQHYNSPTSAAWVEHQVHNWHGALSSSYYWAQGGRERERERERRTQLRFIKSRLFYLSSFFLRPSIFHTGRQDTRIKPTVTHTPHTQQCTNCTSLELPNWGLSLSLYHSRI